MFNLLEKATTLDLNGIANCLEYTWKDMQTRLSNKPILFITYRQVPLLYLEEVKDVISRSLSAGFQLISHDLDQPTTLISTLFVINDGRNKDHYSTWSYILKHLIGSKGNSKFIVVVSEEELEKLRRAEFYRLLEPYYDIFNTIVEDPESLLSWMTGLHSFPPYRERRLPELLFIAAVCKSENEGLDEEELNEIISNLRLLEFNGQTKSFYTWNMIPRFRTLRDLYFQSLGFKPEHFDIAVSDYNFYLYGCLSYFANLDRASTFTEIASDISISDGQNLKKACALIERTKLFPESSVALSFLHRLGIIYTLAQETGPSQFMGITGHEFEGKPTLRRELLWIGDLFNPLKDSLLSEEWKDAGKNIQEYILNLAVSKHVDFKAEASYIEGFLTEYLSRLKEYNDQDIQNLCLKLVKTIYLLEASAYLSDTKLPSSLAEKSLELWTKCLQKITDDSTLNSDVWETLKTRLQYISTFNSKYKNAIRSLRSKEVKIHILQKVQDNKKAQDIIEDFFNYYASLLKENDFLLDNEIRKQIAPLIAERYLELDASLHCGEQPFSEETRSNLDSTGLIPSIDINQFDRVFIVIIDAFSYLDWKISRDEFFDLDTTESIEERYVFSTVPTYTPCALTALITGYHPSISGICDWTLRDNNNRTIDLQSADALKILQGMPTKLPKKNVLTLIHSQANTPLTFLQTSIAQLYSKPLPSTEYEKAIAQASQTIYQTEFDTKIVAIYIADFDEFGHWHLRLNAWREYYSMQAGRIKNGLIKPILKRAQREQEKTLIILTADHGKLTRYESRILSTVLPESNAFQQCLSLLSSYNPRNSNRHILAWIPDDEANNVANNLRQQASEDVRILAGQEINRYFPAATQTPFVNPNLLVLSRSGTRGQHIAHGGASISEVVIPAIRIVSQGD